MKIDIISGFLGAGKTTFIKRLLNTELKNEKVILIENEYGEISIDSALLLDTKVEIKELSQGCICCSLAGDFSKSLGEVISKYNPDRVLIEPSGVGKLTDVIKAVSDAGLEESINSLVCMVDASKAKMYDKNFAEFFRDQIRTAQTVILSRTDTAKPEKIDQAVEIVRKLNEKAVVVTTPINDLNDSELLKAYEGVNLDLLKEIDLDQEFDDECDDPNCSCHHHHDHDHEHEHEHDHHEHEHHHHHDHDHECECGCHEEHHHHHNHECDDPNCSCHHDHHGHTAHEVFNTIGFETHKKYDLASLKEALDRIASGEFGVIVRSKGVICATDNNWYAFNITPDEVSVEPNHAIPMGQVVVIGSKFDEEAVKALF